MTSGELGWMVGFVVGFAVGACLTLTVVAVTLA